MIRTLDLTPEIEDALRAYEVALATFKPGGESASVVELPLIDLATLVVQALGLPTMQDRFDAVLGAAHRPRRR